MKNIAATFSKNIRREREAQNLSQKALAIRAGISRTHLSKVERNISVVRLRTAVKIANALGVDLGSLLK